VQHTSKRKRVSLLTPWAEDPQCLFRCDGDVQRCDAKRPCTPCIDFDGGSECVYERSLAIQRTREKLPAAIQPFLFSFRSGPRPYDPAVTSDDLSLSTPDNAPSGASSPVFSSRLNSSNVSPNESSSSDSDTLDEFEPHIPRERSNPGMQLVPFRGEYPMPHQPATISTFSLLSSLRFASIPRPLHTQLSLLSPEHLQISDTTPSELDLSLCVFPFFGRNNQKSRELTPFDQPPCGARAIETIWDLPDGFQARRCNAR